MAPVNKSFAAGSILFRENDRSRDMYLVHSGKVKVYRTDKGQRIELCEIGKGGIVGEMSLLDGRARSATVEVTEEIEATVISIDEFEKKSHQIPEWFMAIIRILCTRLRDTDRRVRASLDSDTVANIATLLSIMVNRKKDDSISGHDELDLKFAKSEIMEILSLTHDKVTSALKEIEEQSLVAISNNRIQIPDKGSLELFSRYKRGEIADSSIEAGAPLSAEAMNVLRLLYESVKKAKTEKNGLVEVILSELGEKGNALFANGDFLAELASMEVVSFDEKSLLDDKTAKEAAKIQVNSKKIAAVLAAFLFKNYEKGITA
jgi:CRP/FNR family transcriptional regulator/CRP/FNR family cyclic AMP-dependent transcriptional regulator